MAISKVVYGDTTLIDITDTTATASDVNTGKYFYLSNGERIQGTSVGGGMTVVETIDEYGGTIVDISGDPVVLQTKTATPSTSSFVLAPDSGFKGLSEVTVEAIPSNYIIPTGTINITENEINVNIGQYAYADISVSGGTPNLQIKTNVSPTESSQTIEADSGYDGLESVQVNAISSSYVGSDITRRDDRDLTASGATVTVPAGYYAEAETKNVASGTAGTPTATKGTVSSNSVTVTPSVTNTAGYISGGTKTGTAVTVSASELVSGTYSVTSSGTKDVTNYASASIPAGTVTAPSTISGTSANVSTGTNTLTLTKTVSVTPNVSTAGYISSGTTGNSSVSLTASVTTQAAQTIHPSTNDQTIASGKYLTGTQTINAVILSNLIADNIKSGIIVKVGDSSDDDCVASVTGTYSGGSGGSGLTLLKTASLGTLSTSSTSAADTGKTMTVTGYNDYDVLVVDVSVDSVTNGRHTSTVSMVYLTGTSAVTTKNTYTVGGNKWNSKLSSSGTGSTRQSTSAYGIYVYSASVSSNTMTLTFYYRYNSNHTGTLNGTYTARVYGLKLYDLIGG